MLVFQAIFQKPSTNVPVHTSYEHGGRSCIQNGFRLFIINTAKKVMFSPGFVRLFVNKITQKLMDGF